MDKVVNMTQECQDKTTMKSEKEVRVHGALVRVGLILTLYPSLPSPAVSLQTLMDNLKVPG